MPVVEITDVYKRQVNRLHGWIHFYAPWGLGTQFPFKTKEDVAELSRLVGS